MSSRDRTDQSPDAPGRVTSPGPRRAAAILDATLDLLATRGYPDLTIEAVADRAGVNKTTIYRWWPSKATLVGAALISGAVLDLTVADTGTLRGDLIALTHQIAALLTVPPASDIAVATLGAAVHDPHLAGVVRSFFADRLARERPIVIRAMARGEIPADTDPMLLVDLLSGAVWIRAVFRGQPVEPDLVTQIVDTVLNGVTGSGHHLPRPD